MRLKPALTLMELVLVIGLAVVLVVPFVISFTGFSKRLALKSSGENLANILRTARVSAREERSEQAWGLRYVDEGTYSMVMGSKVSFSVYRGYVLEKPVVFKSSFSDIWFEQASGETDENYRIELFAGDGLEGTVEVAKTGIVKFYIN